MKDRDFIIVAFAVIDTNVIISSFIGSKKTATKEIMEYIDNGNIIPLFDQRIIDEYYEVIQRFYSTAETEEIIEKIKDKGYFVNDVQQTKEYFKDKTDIPFFEIKESAKELEPYLVTGNIKHYPDDSARTPAFVVDVLRYLNGFVIRDKEQYLADLKEIVDSLANNTKYTKAVPEKDNERSWKPKGR